MDTLVTVGIVLTMIAAGTLTIRRLNRAQAHRAATMSHKPLRRSGKRRSRPGLREDRSGEAS
ncbi:hypothetical protein [Streptomyces marispadix]|uniref:Uncharacterized protein n=1 Tax=Streptomyces marispadix TaxID=2922868 RepID=A0ABS9T4D3_9ACTN|nr:hypothetical protein [Streptomyces marispadix]MCH6163399.1 hypothetical protein [Streptomyces marispadix]